MFDALIALLLASAPAQGGPAKGLWIGNLALCRDSVAFVEAAAEGPGPVLHIALAPGFERHLERLTAKRVGRKLPIRFDGRIVSAPLIREPLTGGRIALSGAGLPLEAIAEAARGSC